MQTIYDEFSLNTQPIKLFAYALGANALEAADGVFAGVGGGAIVGTRVAFVDVVASGNAITDVAFVAIVVDVRFSKKFPKAALRIQNFDLYPLL